MPSGAERPKVLYMRFEPQIPPLANKCMFFMRQAGDLRPSPLQEPIDQPGKARRGGVKGGADGIAGHLLQLAGNNGGEQGMRQFCTLRLVSG